MSVVYRVKVRAMSVGQYQRRLLVGVKKEGRRQSVRLVAGQ